MDDDKRRHHRFDCTGRAKMQIPPEQPIYEGEIRNLSLGGCLIGFHGPQQIGVDEKCELLFCVNNLPFRVLGKMRSQRSLFEYGFEFLYVSTRLQPQLEELMEELKDPPVRMARVIPMRPRLLG